MPAFIDKDGAAVEAFRGVAFVDRDEIQRPSNWLELATPEELAGAQIREDWPVEPPAPPAGKVLVLGPPVVEGDQVVRSYSLEDAPAPQPDPVPESVTNSDWRVGLILWGRFAEVEAKVIAARESGTVEGQIVWQRWEYANDVFRAELLARREAFGFSAEEVDESLRRAAAVSAAARAA